ncbi:MAG TPA: hypothetical protein VKV39_00500 [Candidatus Sulfotelmatobacter sp.]|nr:hypothetical protein [Candidatus Sulfotelmatobacter sp.]
MPDTKIVRDETLAAPPGLDEVEQQDVMLRAVKLGLRRPTDDLTAVPAGSPPPGAGWRKVKDLPAPGSGKPYSIYIFSHDPPRRGPVGTGSRPPAKHPGLHAKTHHQKPHAPTGSSDSTSPAKPNKKPDEKKEQWLGSTDSDHLTEATEAVRAILDDPAATEDQITVSVQRGLDEARNVSKLSDGNDPRVTLMMQQIAKATTRVGEMRNEAFEKILDQEERSPNSVPDQQITYHVQRVLGAERQRQLLGADQSQKTGAMELVARAIGIVGDRKADAVQNLLDQDKRTPGSISEAQFSKAVTDLIGVARQTQLLGIDRPKANAALDSVAEVMQLLIRRKAEARRKMLEQKNDPNSGVTDQQIQDATLELSKMKQEAQRLGIQPNE